MDMPTNLEELDRLFIKMAKQSHHLQHYWREERGRRGGDRFFHEEELKNDIAIHVFSYDGSLEHQSHLEHAKCYWIPNINDLVELVKDDYPDTISLVEEFRNWARLNIWSHKAPMNFCWLMFYMRLKHHMCFDLPTQSWKCVNPEVSG